MLLEFLQDISITSFNLYKNCKRKILFFLHFVYEEAEAQRYLHNLPNVKHLVEAELS